MSKANGKIEIGDTVRLRWPDKLKKQGAGNVSFTVAGKPGNQVMDDTWWTLVGDQSGALLIVTELIVLEVLN